MVQRSWVMKVGVCMIPLVLVAVLGMGCATEKQLKEHRTAAEAAMKAAQAAAQKAEAAAGNAEAAARKAQDSAARAEAEANRAKAEADRACACAEEAKRILDKMMRK